MKTIGQAIIGAVALSFAAAIHSFAITNTAIAVSGTNLVLSWPSYGYEHYLIQYRQTLDPTDSWSTVTNDYPANSTNRSTFVMYGLVPLPDTNSVTGNVNTNPPPSPDGVTGTTTGSSTTSTSELMVVPANGSGNAAPLILFPPGFNLSGYTIYDPTTGKSISGDGYTIPLSDGSTASTSTTPLNNSSSDPPSTGFYRVFHIPDWLVDITNYVFNGPTFIPVDYASPDAPVDRVDNTTVLINGQPTDDAVFTSYPINGVTNWGVGIYFDRFPNGTNTIQLLTTVRESDTLNDQTPYMVFSNAPTVIDIENSIMFTNWSELILSNSYTFQAQSSVSNVNWEIDIYDVNNNLVNYQTGYSANGNISWTWNLTDTNGTSRLDDSDPFFFPYITVTPSSSSPTQSGGIQPNASSGTSEWMPPLANQFPSEGDWLFSWLDNFYDDGTSNYAGADYYYTNAISQMEGGPTLWNIGFIPIPLKFGRVYSQTNRDASWSTLQAWLESWNNRNLYYFGHGAPNAIGGDISTLDSSNNITGSKSLPGSKAYLTSKWVHDNVTDNSTWGPMPFRFVFLDGCDTANGGWPGAWGVPKQAETLSYYESAANTTHARPSAFVGWNVEIGGSTAWGTVQNFWLFRQYWMANWSVQSGQSDDDLNAVFEQARSASNWVPYSQLWDHLKIYGYQTMKFTEYNQRGNWP